MIDSSKALYGLGAAIIYYNGLVLILFNINTTVRTSGSIRHCCVVLEKTSLDGLDNEAYRPLLSLPLS